ncbi:MAG TPA: peptide ABC transporter substrate-binding protein [Candidatus Baltobacteraceae bacterium]|nr:peptide ABC transporter substrate-binding protein [Candidatus Baltobacteraceae bacterium]
MRWAAAAAVLSMCSAGCAGAGGGAASPSSSVGLRIAQQWEPQSLNPALENGTSAAEWGQLLFSYLLNYDGEGRLVGDAAIAVPTPSNGGISRDGLTITYHLRSGIRFADGVPLTARDCVWSVQAIQNPRNLVQSRFAYDVVARADAPDDRTLVLHLKKRFPPAESVVMAPQGFPILPRHLLAQYSDFNRIPFDAKPIGSGPYVVDSWQRGDRVVMHPNPYFFKGVPSIKKLQIQFVPDPQSAINLLQTHEIQGFENDQDVSNYAFLKTIPGYSVTATPEDAVGSIILNTQSALTSDPRVRTALARAVDVRTLVEKSYRGAVDARDAGRGLFLWAYDPAAYPAIPYDPASARRLLDEAGWRLGTGGIRERNGVALRPLLIIQAGTPIDAIAANLIAQYERAVGVDVAIKQFNVTQLVAPASEGGPVYGGKFQMAYYDFENGADPDTTDQFACRNVPPNGYNKSRLCDPVVDSLLEDGLRTYDRSARKAAYALLQRRIYADMPLALLFQRRQINAFSTRIRGIRISPWGPFWNVQTWRIQ